MKRERQRDWSTQRDRWVYDPRREARLLPLHDTESAAPGPAPRTDRLRLQAASSPGGHRLHALEGQSPLGSSSGWGRSTPLDQGRIQVRADSEGEYPSTSTISRSLCRDCFRITLTYRRLAVGYEQH